MEYAHWSRWHVPLIVTACAVQVVSIALTLVWPHRNDSIAAGIAAANVAIWSLLLYLNLRYQPTPPPPWYDDPVLHRLHRRIVWLRRATIPLQVIVLTLNVHALYRFINAH